ncbi:MAG: hypothetical protein JRI25_05075 [Deltaproteobacteria bacterium]|nr:hypothetical protein [Deltaproteobacteria bacterium]MBW2253954.1 hypothetical protein [Deltaproteobacteria bacterium]
MKTLRTGSLLAILGAALVAGTALAEPPTASPAGTQSVTLPTGKTVDAQKFVEPAEGSLEHGIIASMNLIKAGSFDAYISQWCHANTCPDAAAITSLKTYQLKSSQKTVHECMTEDGGILVTKREANEAEGSTRVYVFCGPNRMPAPSSLILVGEAWKVASFSW